MNFKLNWSVHSTLNQSRLVNKTMAQDNAHPGYKQLTDIQNTKCLTLDRNRKTQRAIATELGCDYSTVSRTLK